MSVLIITDDYDSFTNSTQTIDDGKDFITLFKNLFNNPEQYYISISFFFNNIEYS